MILFLLEYILMKCFCFFHLKEQYTLKKQVFGDMSNISKEEYLEFYHQTGIEIDNRQQILIEALKFIEDMISKLVKFAKFIPGFSELDIDDQVNLVKGK